MNADCPIRRLPFVEQLAVTRNTDIFVGMHGAGLTHLLFLPRWASLFELYNCNDASCYRDLARIRGVDYVTWERPDMLQKVAAAAAEDAASDAPAHEGHEKFSNYRFDVGEFVRLVRRTAAHVSAHPAYRQFVAGGADGDGGVVAGSGYHSDEL